MNSETNKLVVACGYSPLQSEQFLAISEALGAQWQTWLHECSRAGQGCSQWSNLRSSLMAVSELVSCSLRRLNMTPSMRERVLVFHSVGRPLRSAFAALGKTSSTEAESKAAEAFVRQCFAMRPIFDANKITAKVHHVYGSKSAVTFECSKGKDGRSCLQIEAAVRTTKADRFDWERKIILQLSDDEVLQVLAVLRRWLNKVEIDNHGGMRDKRITLSAQPTGYLISVRQGNRARVVPIPTFEAFSIVSLALKALMENAPHMGAEMILEMAREMASSKTQTYCSVSGNQLA